MGRRASLMPSLGGTLGDCEDMPTDILATLRLELLI